MHLNRPPVGFLFDKFAPPPPLTQGTFFCCGWVGGSALARTRADYCEQQQQLSTGVTGMAQPLFPTTSGPGLLPSDGAGRGGVSLINVTPRGVRLIVLRWFPAHVAALGP